MVTGAARGIGAASARRLAEEGCRVVVVDVDVHGAEALAAELGADALALGADVSSEAEVAASMEAAVHRFGGVDLFHLNAGIGGAYTPISEAETDDYDRVMAVDLRGVFFGLREAIPQLQRTHGAVVVTASQAGLVPLPGNPLYAATKWALIGLVRSVHADLEARGIRINALCPGAVATPLMGDDPHALFERMGVPSFEPEDLAATVVEMLASDRSGEAVLHRPPWPPEPFEFARLPEH